jgi:penicillin-binding protein 1A
MALPIWALYMKKVYADKKLNLYTGDFEAPLLPLSVEINCGKYEQQEKKDDKGYDVGDF